MNASTAQLNTGTGIFRDRITDARPEDSDGLFSVLVRWRILEGRFKDYKRMVKNDGIRMDIHPRSDEDVAHFEQNWKDTGRDVYRFTAF